MKKNQNGHDLTDTHAPMTAALSMSVLDTLLFPLWNENTTKIVGIAKKFNEFIHACS
ncbi:hypothetical protein KKJ17_16620 [Xenorhabdus bovienii]|nr:hypothetical protein [Xenorhabdus bovienii]